MNKSELRYSISAEQYLDQNHVMVYLEDAMSQLLEHKDDGTKISASKFFASYFASVKDGTHVLLREYSFVRATPHNRASFVLLCWKTFSNIARKIELMNMYEYHSLLSLICPDLPMSLVQQTARIVLVDDSLDCLMTFTDFIYAFQLRLCYDEFLNKCNEAYKSLMQNRASNLEAVVVPTSEGRPHSTSVAHGNSGTTASNGGASGNTSNDGIDSTLFHRSLIGICEKFDASLPADILKNVLSAVPRTTFYGFLNLLAKSPSVNVHIGKLPMRSELLTTFEPEMTSKTFTPPPVQPSEAVITDQRPPSSSSSLTTASAPTNTIRTATTSSSSRSSNPPRPGSSSGTSSGRLVNPPSASQPLHHPRHHQQGQTYPRRLPTTVTAAAAAKNRNRNLVTSYSDDFDEDDDDNSDDDNNELSFTG